MTVREQLRQAYVESGRTITQIATDAGVSENTVLNIFRGRNVTTSNLLAVASVLQIRAISVDAN